MLSFNECLLKTLGKEAASSEVTEAIQRFGLEDIYDDPPFRRYVGSSEKGVDLLFENGTVIDIQIFVQGSETHSAFSEVLPFHLQQGMTCKQVHALLGEPESHDVVGSKYSIFDGAVRLSIGYDKSDVMSYLSVGNRLES